MNNKGNPVLTIIIFIFLMSAIYFLPKIYDQSTDVIVDVQKDSTLQSDISQEDATSAYYKISESSEVSFNDIKVTKYNYDAGILTFFMETTTDVNLDTKNYYIEFYQNKVKFLGRRQLTGTIKNNAPIKIELGNIMADADTYITISHIDLNVIPQIKLDTDESGIGELECVLKDESYRYIFASDKLLSVMYKYNYSNYDLNVLAEKSIEMQNIVKTYNNYTGVDASLVSDNNNLIMIINFDHEKMENINNKIDYQIFKKEEKANVIKFIMEAKGYECK